MTSHLSCPSSWVILIWFDPNQVERGWIKYEIGCWLIGLDPAFPLFSIKNTDLRLDTSDAKFVDVIHTNSGTLTQAALSFPMAIGHADFFPNGGHSQPGCGLIKSGGIYDLLGKRWSCLPALITSNHYPQINSFKNRA